MRITQAHFVAGYSAFYFDDQKAIKNGAGQDGFVYVGNAVTEGFHEIRQAGECVSVLLVLENGSVAVGDCAAVQYSGAGGRDPLFLGKSFVPFLEQHLKPLLEGRAVDTFLDNARYFDTLEIDGKRLHTAIRYGLTQALLDATALSRQITKAEVILDEYHLPLIAEPVPLFGQSGDDRYSAVDKMLLKDVDALPHGLINNVPDKLGYKGEKLEEYIRWLVARVEKLRTRPDYRPCLHIDVYGTIGLIFDQDANRVADYIAGLEKAAGSLDLYIEGPVDAGSKEAQIEELGKITRRLQELGSPIKLVADEWCNTFEDVVDFTDARCCHMAQIKTPDLGGIHNIVEAVLYCNSNGMEAYQGGTCNETDVSARTCVHLALAARPMRMLVKPGMGFDEGMNIVYNEMHRTLARLKARKA
ncbi:MAG: methylaspartate ammonia-lyase [Propionivibrio sp.]|jgi:methylaspartate ammonia-lyase|nr:methylaspartate ammonia-lyase [Propionivibrio sp.]MBP6709781.1 methylaspartate ammonia-lyase [Propionivibrio sp.]MBP7523191.1 methylaspartate ammonia-lyase [Propionivibrio sp.]MBP8162472.1 methylaspartate ammonia-lyase [Propionivibrio sp.]